MAKYGQGDRRWIVEERADGQNVHNWHWMEKDCLGWSRTRLGELLGGLTVASGEGSCWCRTTKVESVEGEAYVNIRKGKMIPGYELKVKVKWEGECRDGDGRVAASAAGRVELPYIADENADESPEVRVMVTGEGPAHGRLRDVMVARGRPLIQEKVAIYVREMKKGGPAKDDLAKKSTSGAAAKSAAAKGAAGGGVGAGGAATGVSPPSTDFTGAGVIKGGLPPSTANSNSNSNSSAAVSNGDSAPPAPPAKKTKGLRTITMSQTFFCRATDIYGTFLDESKWKGFTQSDAKISREEGGAFSIFGGAVTGINMKLETNTLILQKWRFSNWADGHYSTVCLTFEEPEVGTTIVKLTQTDVPEEDRFGNHTVVENTERGWREHIFNKIRAVFGFGC